MAEKKRVLIDCDPGVDDALALLLAHQCPAINLCAITTVGGNQVLESTLENALGIVRLLGADVPVSAGAAGPILGQLKTAAYVHGDNGLAGVPFTSLAAPTPYGALEAMRRFAAEGPGVIVAVGPLTNVAIFLLACPELKKNIESICIMGGSTYGGNSTPAAEYNIYVDPEAAAVVFESGIPIMMHGLDTTNYACITQKEAAPLKAMKSAAPALAARLLDYAFASSEGYLEPDGQVRSTMHDVNAVMYLQAPHLFKTKHCRVDVETQSPLCRGCTAVDFDDVEGKPKNTLVVYDVDREGFVKLFMDAMARYEEEPHG